jgi:hypothetical protein
MKNFLNEVRGHSFFPLKFLSIQRRHYGVLLLHHIFYIFCIGIFQHLYESCVLRLFCLTIFFKIVLGTLCIKRGERV